MQIIIKIIIEKYKMWRKKQKLKIQKRKNFYATAKICYNCISLKKEREWEACYPMGHYDFSFCIKQNLRLQNDKCTCKYFEWKPKPVMEG